MFGLSGEHLLILAGILLIFGPRKLPELGSSVGRAFRNFKEGLNGPTSSGQLETTTTTTAVTAATPEKKTAETTTSPSA